jgi:hypothetical protein
MAEKTPNISEFSRVEKTRDSRSKSQSSTTKEGKGGSTNFRRP